MMASHEHSGVGEKAALPSEVVDCIRAVVKKKRRGEKKAKENVQTGTPKGLICIILALLIV